MDLNEEYSALDKNTLLDQSLYVSQCISYLLNVYPDYTHFPIVAHSMGGIVVKHALLKYDLNPINWTLFTIATPHLEPPIPLNRGIYSVYQYIHTQWNYSSSIVSIVGGILDLTVSSSQCRPDFYSTGMNYVWTGADHRALLWCNQLQKQLAKVLLEFRNWKDAPLEIKKSLILNTLKPTPLTWKNDSIIPWKDSVVQQSERRGWREFESSMTLFYSNFTTKLTFFLDHSSILPSMYACTITNCFYTTPTNSEYIPLDFKFVKHDIEGQSKERKVSAFYEIQGNSSLHNLTISFNSLESFTNSNQPMRIGWDLQKDETKCISSVTFSFFDIVFGFSKELNLNCYYTRLKLKGISHSPFVYNVNMDGIDFNESFLYQKYQKQVKWIHSNQFYLMFFQSISSPLTRKDSKDTQKWLELHMWNRNSKMKIKIKINWFSSLALLILHYPGLILGYFGAFSLWFILDSLSVQSFLFKNVVFLFIVNVNSSFSRILLGIQSHSLALSILLILSFYLSYSLFIGFTLILKYARIKVWSIPKEIGIGLVCTLYLYLLLTNGNSHVFNTSMGILLLIIYMTMKVFFFILTVEFHFNVLGST